MVGREGFEPSTRRLQSRGAEIHYLQLRRTSSQEFRGEIHSPGQNGLDLSMPANPLPPEIWELWDGLFPLLNSAFISAFLSSLAGAGAGVLGAQWVSDRSARRLELRTALQQANAATVLAASMVNILAATKRQLIEPMTSKYEADRAEALALLERAAAGQRVELRFEANFIAVTPIPLPSAELGRLIYGSPRMPAQAIATMAMLDQAVSELNSSLSRRAELIATLRSSGHDHDGYLRFYFGLRRRDGNIDSMYPDVMKAIASYTDDALFFTAYVSRRTQAHAEQLAAKLKALDRTFDAARGVSRVDFAPAQEAGTIPSDAAYEDWLKTFREGDAPARPPEQ